VFPTTFCPHVWTPTIGTNLQRRSDSMLRQPLNRRNTSAVCNPLIRIAVVWVIVFNRPFDRHRIYNWPLCTNDLSSNVGPEPKDCWPLLAINLEQTSLSLPSEFDRDHCQVHGCETTLRSTNPVRLRPDHQRRILSDAHDRSEGLAFPFANQTNLTSVSPVVPLKSPSRNPMTLW